MFGGVWRGGKCPAARLICAHMDGTSEGQMLGERIVPMVGDALTQPYQHMCTHLFRKTQNRLDAKVIYSMEFSLLRSHGYSLKAPMNCVIGVYINTSIRLF